MNHITNVISRIFSVVANAKFPKGIQEFINKTYVKKFNIDMSEFDIPENYETLNGLFTRSFKKERYVNADNSTLVSLCDSWISECGKIVANDLIALQIKGFYYSVDSLLGDFAQKEEKAKLQDGVFANLYLSPADYHHYHAPCDMKIIKAWHIPGKLYPVNLKWLNKKASLFVENERVILECETANNAKIFLVFVGALNVGKMKFLFDDKLNTNIKDTTPTLYNYESLYVKKGEELGYFEMGSTVLFFGEKDKFELVAKQGAKIKFGEVLAKEI
ncbi:MAG: phosphatidylserine decarboxylase [Campylobacteraceae bacterium]